MARISTPMCLLLVSICGCAQSREADVHHTIAYVDGSQIPVPPQAISPFEPKDVTYVTEPLIELDSDWNLDVKLFSKYRYTNEFVEKWKARYGFTPTRPIVTDVDFFNAVDLNYPGLEKVKAAVVGGDYAKAIQEYLSYQASRPRPDHFKVLRVSKEVGEAAVKEADDIINDPMFPACDPGMHYILRGLMCQLERAYLYTNDIKYVEAWLDIFNHFYVTHRPPAQRPKMYIAFIWIPNWRTLAAGDSGRALCRSEQWLIEAADHGLDREKLFNVYRSILEHAEFLDICNDVFMPSNWQTTQAMALMETGAYFPAFKKSLTWRDRGWELFEEHMAWETYDDGTHYEGSISYACCVIREYRAAARLARRLGIHVSEEFLRKFESMYLWTLKVLAPNGAAPPTGDGGMGGDGYLVKRAVIQGALEFAEPTLKHFAQQYPDELRRQAEEEFDNTAEVLDAYDQVKAEMPAYTSILLPDAGWAVMRQSWDVDALYMFFDFARDEAWHSHPDFGSFSIWAYGRPIVTNCGRGGAYEADISKRWGKQTISHNTVMVDARSMRKCVDNRLNRWWTGDGYDFADATSDGYRWIGVLHNRRVVFVKPDYWIITDFLPGPSYYGTSFQTTGYHEFDWLAHFQPTELRIDRKTKRIDTSNSDANVALVPLNSDQVEIRVNSGPVGTPASGKVDAEYVSLHQEGLAFVQYQVLLLPYEGRQAPEIGVTRLSADETDRVHRRNVGYEIAALGRKDFLLETGHQEKPVSFGEYSLHGAFAHIRDAGTPTAGYLLIDAELLTHNGKVLFSAPTPREAIEFAIVTETGQAPVLEIMTDDDVSGIRLYAPGVKNVTVNGDGREFSAEGEYVVMP